MNRLKIFWNKRRLSIIVLVKQTKKVTINKTFSRNYNFIFSSSARQILISNFSVVPFTVRATCKLYPLARTITRYICFGICCLNEISLMFMKLGGVIIYFYNIICTVLTDVDHISWKRVALITDWFQKFYCLNRFS